MNTANYKSTLWSFGIVVFALVAIVTIPSITNAQYSSGSPYGYYGSNANPGSTQPPQTIYIPTYVPTYVPVPTPTPVPTPVYIAPEPTPTPTVYSNSVNPNPPVTPAAPKPTPKPPVETPPSDLTASAIGSDSFFPSGLLQWILFGILVLLIVIIIRKIYGGTEKYHDTPTPSHH